MGTHIKRLRYIVAMVTNHVFALHLSITYVEVDFYHNVNPIQQVASNLKKPQQSIITIVVENDVSDICRTTIFKPLSPTSRKATITIFPTKTAFETSSVEVDPYLSDASNADYGIESGGE